MSDIEATRHAIVQAILADPGDPTHRYALADSYEEAGDAPAFHRDCIDDLRLDLGIWLIRWWGNDYRLLWVARVRAPDRLPACHGSHGRVDRPAVNLARPLKADLPRCCRVWNAIPTSDTGVKRCRRDGQCQPCQRIASRHSGWQWCCPAAYARVLPLQAKGVYLP